MLKKLAPYSRDTILSFGMGGLVRLFKGFSLLYHGLNLGFSDSKACVEAVVVAVSVLEAWRSSLVSDLVFSRSDFSGSDEEMSLWEDTTTWRGSEATGSEVCASFTAPTGSVAGYSFS